MIQPLSTSTMLTLPCLNQVIARDCLVVSPQMRLVEAIRRMDLGTSAPTQLRTTAAPTSCILVVEEGQLVGLFSVQDIPRVIAAGVNLEETPIAHCMARSPLSIILSEESTLWSALRLIQDYDLQYLPVLEPDGRVAGVITTAHLYRQLPVLESLQLLESYISRQPNQTTDSQSPAIAQPAPAADKPLHVQNNADLQQSCEVDPHISERRQADAGLREREARFRAIYEQAAVGIARVGRCGQFLQVNQAFCKLLGRTESELLQRTFQQITHPEDIESNQALMRQLWMGQIPTCSMEMRYRCQDGHFRWADLSVSLVHDEKGVPQYSIQALQDISDRKRIEAALWESEARLLHLISASPAVIYTCEASKDYDLTYISYNITDYLGFKTEDFLSQSNFWQTCLHPDDSSRVLDERSDLISQGFQVSEYRLRREDGVYRWVNDQIRLLRDQDGNPKEMVGCILDITDRKEAEEKLKASLQEKEVLLQEIHHRVKNNLQIISSLLYLQANAIDDQQACNALQESRSRVESMALVHENLYQARDFTHIDFVGYVRQLSKNLLNSYLSESTTISFQAWIDPDAQLNLKQALPCGLIVNELVSNALKHGFSNESTGQIWVALETGPDSKLTLSVRNSGDALPADFNLHSSQSMGLELVKALCRQLKGSLELERGDATTFKISFPNHGLAEKLGPPL